MTDPTNDCLFDADAFTVAMDTDDATNAQVLLALRRLLKETNSFVQNARNSPDEMTTSYRRPETLR
jgi:hypothetical protein